MGNNTGNRTSEVKNKIGKIGFSIRGKRASVFKEVGIIEKYGSKRVIETF